ncbi:MAG TPA: ribosomal protein S18-alanine N-acetyltransferase [Candidatus Angelobacter sp.]|nr:ribosomal protein S18-alanine N-acetyltransferase [Candidatus Angelobacter sp.]
MAAEVKREQVITIRTMRSGDAAPVSAILREAPEAVFWPEFSVNEVMGWQGALALVSETGGTITGFLIGRQATDEAEILNLAVEKGCRRVGHGAALLRSAEGEFRGRGVTRLFLEVRESNLAGIAFYKRHDFSTTGRRPAYYREPEEAALVMEKKLAG